MVYVCKGNKNMGIKPLWVGKKLEKLEKGWKNKENKRKTSFL